MIACSDHYSLTALTLLTVSQLTAELLFKLDEARKYNRHRVHTTAAAEIVSEIGLTKETPIT